LQVIAYSHGTEIDDLKNAYEDALAVYQKAVSESHLALQEYIRSGATQDAATYAANTQTESQRHTEYLNLRNRLSLGLMRQQR
jgi:hypothetical protein